VKTRAIALILFLCLATGVVCFAKDPYTGTWKLKSVESAVTGAHPVLGPNGNLTFGLDVATVPVEETVVYEAVGQDNVKVTVQGVLANGKVAVAHYEWTGKFDGKDYPISGDPQSDTRSYKKLDEHTFEITVKKAGVTTPNGQIVVSFHGKKCTVKMGGVTAIYHKQ
jgi:hypothetical protein